MNVVFVCDVVWHSQVFNIKDSHEVIDINYNDGTFFIPFDMWVDKFTSLFIAVKFPSSWTGKRASGRWSVDVGGNREMSTWNSNPKIPFQLSPTVSSSVSSPASIFKEVFVGISINDSRLTLGFNYFQVSSDCYFSNNSQQFM